MINLRLVRHGHTIWSDTGGVAGRTDIDLSDKGRASVNALAKTFRHEAMVGHWFCSPMTRTRETADIIRTVLESTRSYSLPELVFDKRLVELDFGDWEGQTWDEVHQNTPDILANWGEDWVNRSPPNGETFNEQCERCQSWLNDWLTSVQQETEASATVGVFWFLDGAPGVAAPRRPPRRTPSGTRRFGHNVGRGADRSAEPPRSKEASGGRGGAAAGPHRDARAQSPA